MATDQSHLKIQQDGDIVVIEFLDRNIIEEPSIQKIGEQIGGLIDASPNPKLLVNFSGVEHLSSAALGQLITINNKVRDKGGQLRLVNIDPQIYEVFVITKLNQLFHICENLEEAVESFQ